MQVRVDTHLARSAIPRSYQTKKPPPPPLYRPLARHPPDITIMEVAPTELELASRRTRDPGCAQSNCQRVVYARDSVSDRHEFSETSIVS